jgi:adenosylcobinamide-phosphate synthase
VCRRNAGSKIERGMTTSFAVALVLPAAMGIALVIDRVVGEPPARWHPVVGMGRYLAWIGPRRAALPPLRAFVGGALAWCLGAVVLGATAWGLESWLWRALEPWASVAGALALALVLGLLLKPMLAWRMLHHEVRAVEDALLQDLDAGRLQVARLASRDTTTLDAIQIRETAIETLAENLNDSVVAPLFWFAVAGLPGAVVYRFANTADAMWGYRDQREWSGKWAARADDLLSWVPARLTALALLPGVRRWPALAREARRTPSPNGGWPMGAMALALGVRLGKPGVYTLNPTGATATPADTVRALRRAGLAMLVSCLTLMLLAFGLRWRFV